jgi:thymidine phosphorylase
MRAADVIAAKRDGGALSREEIGAFVRGVVDGSWPDYQASALLMAIVWRGMTADETAWLTEAMVESGDTLDLSGLPGPFVDKHSTGGVGDKTSLVVAPLVAACGGMVPMMSGRGLGHTGGTLEAAGCCIVAQTERIAPADRRLYALRDVTATVESVPLISASIMSKKIAEGIGALVLDVKIGAGAFMKTVDRGRELAGAMVRIGARAGVRTEAALTAMDAPLGRAVGNALEVAEAVETLAGRGPADLRTLTVDLAARMLVLAGLAGDDAEARRRVEAALGSGAALERFRRMVAEQGGDPRVAEDSARLPSAPCRTAVRANRAGFLARLDAGLVGRAAVALGAGRSKVGDAVDPAVGAVVRARPGDMVTAGDAVVELHHRDDGRIDEARRLVEQAVTIGDEAPLAGPLVLERVA